MKNILIAYATWSGATREIAERIRDILKSKGFEISIKAAKEIKDINGYQSVLLGTSIHASQTVGAFRKFLARFNKQLITIPTAYFTVCANMMEDSEENRYETLGWLRKVTDKYPDVNPISTGLFGGAVVTEGKDFDKLNFFIKKVIGSMKTKMEEDYGKSDFRDWEKIEAWTLSLAEKLNEIRFEN